MKRILAFLSAALVAFSVNAATLLPIQLLNPAGSTSGQAIISTGASTAPTWGSVSAAALTGLVPVVNGGTGVGTSTGSGSLVLGTSPTITTPNIVGVANGSNAAAGSVGEYVTATGTAVSMTNATPTNVTSISLTAGDWDVFGNVQFIAAASTVIVNMQSGINTVTSTLPVSPNEAITTGVTFSANAQFSQVVPRQRLSLSGTTTVFLVVQAGFNTSTLTTTSYIAARRVR